MEALMTAQGWVVNWRFAVLGILMVVCISVVANVATAQIPTAAISGTVKDSSGAVVPGATITVTNTETGLSRTTRAGNDGSYTLPALPVGTYEVRAEQTGFQTKLQTGLRIAVGDEAVLNFSLDVGTVAETVSV